MSPVAARVEPSALASGRTLPSTPTPAPAPDSMREALATLTRFSAELSLAFDDGRRRRGANVGRPTTPNFAGAHLPVFARNSSLSSVSEAIANSSRRSSVSEHSERIPRSFRSSTSADVSQPPTVGSTFTPYTSANNSNRSATPIRSSTPNRAPTPNTPSSPPLFSSSAPPPSSPIGSSVKSALLGARPVPPSATSKSSDPIPLFMSSASKSSRSKLRPPKFSRRSTSAEPTSFSGFSSQSGSSSSKPGRKSVTLPVVSASPPKIPPQSPPNPPLQAISQSPPRAASPVPIPALPKTTLPASPITASVNGSVPGPSSAPNPSTSANHRDEGRKRRQQCYREIVRQRNNTPAKCFLTGAPYASMFDIDDHVITHDDVLWAKPIFEAFKKEQAEKKMKQEQQEREYQRNDEIEKQNVREREREKSAITEQSSHSSSPIVSRKSLDAHPVLVSPPSSAKAPFAVALTPAIAVSTSRPPLSPQRRVDSKTGSQSDDVASEGFFDNTTPLRGQENGVPLLPSSKSRSLHRGVSPVSSAFPPRQRSAEIGEVQPASSTSNSHKSTTSRTLPQPARSSPVTSRVGARLGRVRSTKLSFRFNLTGTRERDSRRGSKDGSTKESVENMNEESPSRSPFGFRRRPLRAATFAPGRTSLGARTRSGRPLRYGSARSGTKGSTSGLESTRSDGEFRTSPAIGRNGASQRREISPGNSNGVGSGPFVASDGTPSIQTQSYCKTGSVPGLRRTRFLRLMGSELVCYTRDLNRELWKTQMRHSFVKVNENQRKIMVFTLTARRPIVFYLADHETLNSWSRALARASMSSLPRKYTSQKTAKELQREGIYL